MCASPRRLCNTAFSELVCSVFQGWLRGPGLTIIFAVASRRLNDRLARLSNRQHKHIQVYTWLQQTHISFYCGVRERGRGSGLNRPRCLTPSLPHRLSETAVSFCSQYFGIYMLMFRSILPTHLQDGRWGQPTFVNR